MRTELANEIYAVGMVDSTAVGRFYGGGVADKLNGSLKILRMESSFSYQL